MNEGLNPKKNVAYFSYDFSKHGGAVGDITIQGDGIPDHAIITKATIDTPVAVTSGGLATIALQLEAANDLLAAEAIATFAVNAIIDGVPDNTAANAIRTTAARNSITATIAVAALTAGAFVVALEYIRPRG